jgi:hypothetical protein
MIVKIRTLLLLLLQGFAITTYSQIIARNSIDSTQVSLDARRAIRSQYPAIKQVKWNSIGALSYEAVFERSKKCYYIHVRKDGVILASKYAVELKDIPDQVIKIIRQENSGFKITQAFVGLNNFNEEENYIFYMKNKEETREVLWPLID